MFLGARLCITVMTALSPSSLCLHKKTDNTTAAVTMMLSQFNMEPVSVYTQHKEQRGSCGVKENIFLAPKTAALRNVTTIKTFTRVLQSPCLTSTNVGKKVNFVAALSTAICFTQKNIYRKLRKFH